MLTCRGSNASPRVITTHRMGAFLLARATAAFCQPARTRRAVTHKEIGSLHLCASGLFESGFLRARGGFADRRIIVGVVLAAGALAAIRADELRGDDACVQAQGSQLARPVVRAGAGFHGDDAARRQLGAPGQEFVARQGAAGEHLAGGIDGMYLNHALGQIDACANGFTSNDSSCNLLHGTSPFNGLRLMTSNTTNLGASTPLPEGGKPLRIPKRTVKGLRPSPAAYVKR